MQEQAGAADNNAYVLWQQTTHTCRTACKLHTRPYSIPFSTNSASMPEQPGPPVIQRMSGSFAGLDRLSKNQ